MAALFCSLFFDVEDVSYGILDLFSLMLVLRTDSSFIESAVCASEYSAQTLLHFLEVDVVESFLCHFKYEIGVKNAYSDKNAQIRMFGYAYLKKRLCHYLLHIPDVTTERDS